MARGVQKMATIPGTSGDDELSSQATEFGDTFEGSLGSDIIDGAEGLDTVTYGPNLPGVSAIVTTVALSVSGGGIVSDAIGVAKYEGPNTIVGTDRLSAIEAVNAIGIPHSLDVNVDDNFLDGEIGVVVDMAEGTLRLRVPDDSITFPGNLDDYSLSVSGLTQVTATDAADEITGSLGDDIISSLGGADFIDGGEGDDLLDGGIGNDFLAGGDGNDRFLGSLGDSDLIVGGVAINEIELGADNGNNDTIDYGKVGGTVSLGLSGMSPDSPILSIAKGEDQSTDLAVQIERVIGSDGVGDVIDGRTLDGLTDEFDNPLNASLTVDLGEGTVDFVFGKLSSPSDFTTVSLDISGFETVEGSQLADTITGSTSTADLTLRGNAGDDSLTGGAGSDTISGGEGSDILAGGTGTNTLDGGEGIDTLTYAALVTGVAVDLNAGTTTATDLNDSFSNIETVVGSANADTFVLGTSALQLREIAVDGGAGDDTFTGSSASAMAVEGGQGNDTLTYAASDTSVNLSVASIADGAIQFMAIKGGPSTTTDFATGVETFVGSDAGSDTIDGSTLGNLPIFGGDPAGASLAVDVGAGTLGIDFANPGYTDVSYSISGFETVRGTQNADTITGGTSTVDLVLVGNAGNDSLTGGAGNDTIYGGEGQDTIAGGAGNDTLQGGEGNDRFVGSLGGNDFMAGDTIFGAIGNGSDTDSDTVDYSSAAGTISLGLANDDSGSPALRIQKGQAQGTDTAVQVERVIGSDAAGDVIDGRTLDALAGGLNAPIDASLKVDLGLGTAEVVSGDSNSPFNFPIFNLEISGFETVEGSKRADTITGGTSTVALTLNGNDGDDSLTGGAGNDTLTGGLGNDIIAGGTGENTINGGLGFDTVSYAESQISVRVDLVRGQANGNLDSSIGDTFQDSLTSIEKIVGSSGDDVFIIDNGPIVIDGGEGVDAVNYGGRLNGAGNDDGLIISLDPGAEDDGITADYVLVNIENVTASNGDDWIVGDVTPREEYGVDNRFYGRGGDDILDGGMGDDVLNGGEGNDSLLGGQGYDTAAYEDARGPVTVRLDLDYAEVQQGDAAVERDELLSIENVSGSQYDDLIIGDAGENSLEGGSGNDKLEGGADEDYLDGGKGIDAASYIHSTRGVTAALTDYDPRRMGPLYYQESLNTGDAEGDRYENIENLEGTNFADALYGNTEGNLLQGRAGKDALYGNGGNDVLEGGLEADSLNGGAGLDIASYENAAAGVQASLVARKNALDGGAQDESRGDTYVSIEGLRGSVHTDRLVGNAGSNLLEGMAGNDTLEGGAGSDRLDGGIGDDRIDGGTDDDWLIGGAGNDILTGGDGSDTVDYSDAAAGLTVDLAQGFAGTGTDRDTLSAIEHVLGSAFGDTLIGDDFGNRLSGGAGNDTMTGGGGVDRFDGGEGSDTVSYASDTAGLSLDLENQDASTGVAAGETLTSVENLIGGSGNDTLKGDGSDNRLAGGAGDDLLDGRDGANTLDGGAGNDRLLAGIGRNALDGGAGVDTVDYSQATAGRTIDLQASGSDSDSLIRIENVIGSSLNDVITGDRFNNVLQGGAGDDALHGNKGDDTLDGGVGSNLLNGGSGTDSVSYAAGDAGRVTFSTAASTVDRFTAPGGALLGTDQLLSIENLAATASTADLIDGSAEVVRAMKADLTAGTLSVTGAGTMSVTGFENVTGGALADGLTGDAGANILTGGGGDDQVSGMAGDDLLQGGAGEDTLSGGTGADRLEGDAGNDRLDGGDGNDELLGGTGNDVLFGGDGLNLLDGGEGSDTVDYSAFNSGRTVDLAVGSSIGAGTNDALISIENINAGRRDDILIGDGNANRITAGSGNDIILGGLGTDALYGEKGNDVFVLNSASEFATGEIISGGSDYDVIRLATTAAGTLVLTGNVTSVEEVRISDAAGNTTGTQAINIDARGLNAGAGITLVGNSGVNELWGNNDGQNTLIGGAGNDFLNGGALSDILVGGEGADIMDGGAGVDWADYSTSSLSVSVNLEDLVQGAGGALGDQLIGIENVTGSSLNDFIRGNALANHLMGGLGNDDLQGFAGADILEGGLGADVLTGGDGIDTATYRNAATGVTVDLSGVRAGTGEAAGDSFFQVENLEGSANGDILSGNAAANGLFGGAGNDRLAGGAGADQLTGGTGADTFVFAKGDGADRILDFTASQGDLVSLSGFGAQLDSYAELSALFQQVGGNVVVNAGGGDTLTFVSATTASLTAEHFLFG
jgi:Ca2+-binding RTX toxin-like protein